MNVLLISTYELGRQPFGLASPAAWLRAAGFTVRALDLAQEPLDDASVASADFIAFYLPMHTATRIALRVAAKVRRLNPGAHLAAYGLYAPMNAEALRAAGFETLIGGEFEAALVEAARRVHNGDAEARRRDGDGALPAHNERHPERSNGESRGGVEGPLPYANVSGEVGVLRLRGPAARDRFAQDDAFISLERHAFRVPERGDLPPLHKYARLALPGGALRVAGYTEASRGCKHLCRHCPIVPVYAGQFRVVPHEIVLADIRQQVEAGAEHITFGDPDFFNGVTHATRIVEMLHAQHPHLTYDVTIKVEHLLRHADALPTLARTGCLFVTSAVEFLDDNVLLKLEKGHTRADFFRALDLCDNAALALQPTFVPFTPWTTRSSYFDLLETIADHDLIAAVPSIQLAIRLLIPSRSRLLELPEIATLVEEFDAEKLFYPWRHSDPALDSLPENISHIVAAAEKRKESRSETFGRIRDAAAQLQEIPPASFRQVGPQRPAPYLSEPWYC